MFISSYGWGNDILQDGSTLVCIAHTRPTVCVQLFIICKNIELGSIQNPLSVFRRERKANSHQKDSLQIIHRAMQVYLMNLVSPSPDQSYFVLTISWPPVTELYQSPFVSVPRLV